MGLIFDVALFNLLRVTVLAPQMIVEGPVIAKVISTPVAIIVNWIGSRHRTFRLERRRPAAREAIKFYPVRRAALLI